MRRPKNLQTDYEKITTTYPKAGLATGAKAAAEATVAIKQKAVFMVNLFWDCERVSFSGRWTQFKATAKQFAGSQ
jgi:hypothetical protein